ncbi:MAG: HEAT repeat domain-containing protein, partial [Blastocatellia bacterium]|nr:HEAT repeat domain-containing protein [Blastocatellia bacterium]
NIVYSLSGANGWQVLQVADKLINMRIDISHLLLEMLQSSGAVKAKREAVSKTVLELIADFGQRSSERFNINLVRSAIMQFMNSDSIDLKARAIRAFAAVGIETGEELEAILLSLTDKHWEVRAVAARALGQIGLEGAVPYLANSLMDEAWWVRHNAAHSLARLGQQGIDALREKLDSDDRFARDISKQVIEELQLDAAVRG